MLLEISFEASVHLAPIPLPWWPLGRHELHPCPIKLYSPSAYFVFLFFSLLALFLVRLSWGAWALLTLIHAQTTFAWLKCHLRARWLSLLLSLTVSLLMTLCTSAKQFTKVYHLRGRQFLLDVRCLCQGFAGVQEYEKTRECISLTFELRRYSCRFRWSSVSILLLPSVQFWKVLQDWTTVPVLFGLLCSNLPEKGIEILSRWSIRETSSSSSASILSMSSETRRSVIILPPMLNIPLWSSSVLALIFFRKMWKGVGERRQPCMSDSDRRSVPASYAAIKVDSTGGLVAEVLYNSN